MSRARDIASSGVTSTVLSEKAPLASPDFTGTVDLRGTTLNLDYDQINGSVISGGTWGGGGTFEGTLTGTIASSVSCEMKQYITLSTGWSPWNLSTGSGSTGSEHGVTVQRMGPLYIVNINAHNQSTSTGTFESTILTLDSVITNPTNTVRCGAQYFTTSTQVDYSTHIEIQSDGDIVVYALNTTGDGFHITGNFIGLDTT